MVWIVVAGVIVVVLGGAWLFDRRHRMTGINLRRAGGEDARGEAAAQSEQHRITNDFGRNSFG